MDTYNEWIGPNVILPPTTSESFTLDFKSISLLDAFVNADHADTLNQSEFKILLNNRWGVKVFPVLSLPTTTTRLIVVQRSNCPSSGLRSIFL
jgi:hypothetical protein